MVAAGTIHVVSVEAHAHGAAEDALDRDFFLSIQFASREV
jgi:hypothetical protein